MADRASLGDHVQKLIDSGADPDEAARLVWDASRPGGPLAEVRVVVRLDPDLATSLSDEQAVEIGHAIQRAAARTAGTPDGLIAEGSKGWMVA